MINFQMIFLTSVMIVLYYFLVKQLLNTRFGLITQWPVKKYADIKKGKSLRCIKTIQLVLKFNNKIFLIFLAIE